MMKVNQILNCIEKVALQVKMCQRNSLNSGVILSRED